MTKDHSLTKSKFHRRAWQALLLLMLVALLVPCGWGGFEASASGERVALYFDLEKGTALFFELPQRYQVTDKSPSYGSAQGPLFSETLVKEDGSREIYNYYSDWVHFWGNDYWIPGAAPDQSTLLSERPPQGQETIIQGGVVTIPGDGDATYSGYACVVSGTTPQNTGYTEGRLVALIEPGYLLFFHVYYSEPHDYTSDVGTFIFTVDGEPLVTKHRADAADMLASVRISRTSGMLSPSPTIISTITPTPATPIPTATLTTIPTTAPSPGPTQTPLTGCLRLPEYPNQAQLDPGDPWKDAVKKDMIAGLEKQGVTEDKYYVYEFLAPYDEAEDVAVFYRKELPKLGWQIWEDTWYDSDLYIQFRYGSCLGLVFIEPAPIFLAFTDLPDITSLVVIRLQLQETAQEFRSWLEERYHLTVKDGNAEWTANELAMVTDVLTSLPANYLGNSNVREIRRDHVYIENGREDTEVAGAVVGDVILIFDRAAQLTSDFGGDAELKFEGIIRHEINHCFQEHDPVTGVRYTDMQLLNSDLIREWMKLSGWREVGVSPKRSEILGLRSAVWAYGEGATFVNKYAGTNPFEDMAESARFYEQDPAKLKTFFPEKYEFLKNRVYGGVEFLPSEL